MAPTDARLAAAGLLLALQSTILLVGLAMCRYRYEQRRNLRTYTYTGREEQEEEHQDADVEEGHQDADVEQEQQHTQEVEPRGLSGSGQQGVVLSPWGSTFSKTLHLVEYFGAPALVLVIAVSFAAASFAPIYGQAISVVVPSSSALNTTCQSPQVAMVDADIAGTGIRFAAWAQIELLAALALLGHLHVEYLGVKQLGAGLTVTHLGLAVAMAVQMVKGTLTSSDAIVGAMVLDAQGSALSIQLVAKDVLAARWKVWTSILCQIVGSAVLIIYVIKFRAGDFRNSCFCIRTFWWGWLSDCPETTEAGETTIFWVYLACRMVGSVHNALFAATNTNEFDRADKRALLLGIKFQVSIRRPASLAEDSQRPRSQSPSSPSPDDRTWLHTRHFSTLYEYCPATVNFSYAIHVVFSATSMLAAQNAMNAGMESSSGPVSVGQTTAVVVAVATTSRVLWLVCSWFFFSCGFGLFAEDPFSVDCFVIVCSTASAPFASSSIDSLPIVPAASLPLPLLSTTSISIPSSSTAPLLTPSSWTTPPSTLVPSKEYETLPETFWVCFASCISHFEAIAQGPPEESVVKGWKEALLDRAARLGATSKLTDTLEARFGREQSDEKMIKELVESVLPCTREHDSITVELQLTRIHFIQEMIGDNAFDLCDPNRASTTRCPNPNFDATEYEKLRQYPERVTSFQVARVGMGTAVKAWMTSKTYTARTEMSPDLCLWHKTLKAAFRRPTWQPHLPAVLSAVLIRRIQSPLLLEIKNDSHPFTCFSCSPEPIIFSRYDTWVISHSETHACPIASPLFYESGVGSEIFLDYLENAQSYYGTSPESLRVSQGIWTRSNRASCVLSPRRRKAIV